MQVQDAHQVEGAKSGSCCRVVDALPPAEVAVQGALSDGGVPSASTPTGVCSSLLTPGSPAKVQSPNPPRLSTPPQKIERRGSVDACSPVSAAGSEASSSGACSCYPFTAVLSNHATIKSGA